MKTVRIFKAEPMDFTPFSKEGALTKFFHKSVRFEVVEDIRESSIVIARTLDYLKNFSDQQGKIFVIYTHEPTFNLLELPVYERQNNYFYFYSDSLKETPSKQQFTSLMNGRPVVSLMTFSNKHFRRNIGSKNVDLTEQRQTVAELLYREGLCDIYGQNWPKEITVVENSRQGQEGATWQERKSILLRKYLFNLCLENTACPYYCTEKIWDAIYAGVLPIYSSFNNSIYEDFDKGSFIDLVDFDSTQSLVTFLKNLTYEDFCLRLRVAPSGGWRVEKEKCVFI